jgi:hypothetical protein
VTIVVGLMAVDLVRNVVLTVPVSQQINVVRVRYSATMVFAPNLVSHAVVLVMSVWGPSIVVLMVRVVIIVLMVRVSQMSQMYVVKT